MLSAPNEKYEAHINNCLDEWNRLSSRFIPTFCRLFDQSVEEVYNRVSLMIFVHDVGKLTRKWQEGIRLQATEPGRKVSKPSHAPLGGAYLFELAQRRQEVDDLTVAAVFSVVIHHIDTGLVGANLEYPDVQAIREGQTVRGAEQIDWQEGAQEYLESMIVTHQSALGASDLSLPLKEVTLQSLRDLSEVLRNWSKCARFLDQHKHRLLGSSLHHVLRTCDWRASSRREADKDEHKTWSSVLEVLSNGGLLV